MRTTLTDTIRRFEDRANYYALSATDHLVRGDVDWAKEEAARARYNLHLAYEHRDTSQIVLDAFMGHYGVRK